MTEYEPPVITHKYKGHIPPRWSQDIISLLPKGNGAHCLEFGCGNGAGKHLIEDFGYKWVGIDISGDKVSAQADGHFLPFPNEAFSLVVSIAVFEHLYDPFAAAREVFRVLKPPALFVGTTAFLEPYHAGSYFHMTHLGVNKILEAAGFTVQRLWPTWHVMESMLGNWVPQAPVVHTTLRAGARWFFNGILEARLWALRLYLRRQGYSAHDIKLRLRRELLTWAGAIAFLAIKETNI